MTKIFFMLGSIFGGLGVAFGAYGAHAGAKFLSAEGIIQIDKAVRYQMRHALVLLAVAWAIQQWPVQSSLLNTAGWMFTAGIVLFSGSLYLLGFTGLNVGYLTPLGGVVFMIGWACLALAVWRA